MDKNESEYLLNNVLTIKINQIFITYKLYKL